MLVKKFGEVAAHVPPRQSPPPIGARAHAASATFCESEGGVCQEEKRHVIKMPSYLHGRIARDQPLPRMELAQPRPDDDEESRVVEVRSSVCIGYGGWKHAAGRVPRGVYGPADAVLGPAADVRGWWVSCR